MPSARRTRAMGHSPGGPKALDINAPTRQPRKAKAPTAPKDAPAPATRTTRARSGPKRKNEDITAEEPPAKKSRHTKSGEQSETATSGSQALITLPDSESEHLPESTSSSQEEEPALESGQAMEPRVNAQQPTPPLDTPIDASTVRPITKASKVNMHENASLANVQRQLDNKNKNERRISDMIRHYSTRHHEEEEDEKALSECDDDEWEERYSAVMEQARNPTPFIPNSKGEWDRWTPGSTAMFVVRDPKQKDTAARSKNGSCMPPLTFNSGFFTTMSRLAALGARPLTDIGTIVAVSASLDWYEKNPSIAAPSAAEMNAMLDEFARAKQSQARDPAIAQDPQKSASEAPLTPKVQVTSEALADAPNSLGSDEYHPNIDDQEEPGMEQDGDLTANVENSRVEPTGPQTPQQQHQREGSRTWASALSASAISSVIRTPLNWFTRRDPAKQNISATEPRQVRSEHDVTQSTQFHQETNSRDNSAQSSDILPAKNNSLHDPEATLALDSPTPTAFQPRRGRPDSHLPVHLRGVLFEDLPLEWQAVSQHMKKPQQSHVEDEETEPVDMEYLFATAKRMRKERSRKELQEQAELIAQKQRDLESDDEFAGDRVDRKGKKRVTFSPQKTYSAKLGHSTFGMPANIDDSSSEEEPEALGPRTHFGRNNRPMKSCLKRSYQQPTSEDYSEDADGESGYEPRPAKKARLDEFASSQSPEILEASDDIPWRGEGCESFLYDDDPHRARPFSHFISKPPSELRKAEAAQMEFERLNPRSRGQGFHSEIGRMSHCQENKSEHPNVFTTGGRNPNEAWHKLFQNATKQSPARYQSPTRRRHESPLMYGRSPAERRRLPPVSSRDENGRLIRNTAPLREASEARLNKQREDAMKHKPKTSSGLQVARTLSPIQEKPSPKNMVLDDEVLESVALLDDDEILAEGFGNYPDHVEGTASREASKAIEYPTWFDIAAEAGGARKIDEATKVAEVVEGEEEL